MNLVDILTEIEANKPAASMEITPEPFSTLSGRQGMKRAAYERIRQLRAEYSESLRKSSMFIVVIGSARNQFAQIASSDEYDCFNVDADAFAKNLISKIDKNLFSKERTRFLFGIMQNCLYDRAIELGIREHNPVYFKEEYSAYVKTPEEFLPIVRSAINDQMGPEIIGIDAIERIVDTAIEKKHAAQVTPIIVNCSDESSAQKLVEGLKRLTNMVFSVTAGKVSKNANVPTVSFSLKNVTPEGVGNTLAAIRSNLTN